LFSIAYIISALEESAAAYSRINLYTGNKKFEECCYFTTFKPKKIKLCVNYVMFRFYYNPVAELEFFLTLIKLFNQFEIGLLCEIQ